MHGELQLPPIEFRCRKAGERVYYFLHPCIFLPPLHISLEEFVKPIRFLPQQLEGSLLASDCGVDQVDLVLDVFYFLFLLQHAGTLQSLDVLVVVDYYLPILLQHVHRDQHIQRIVDPPLDVRFVFILNFIQITNDGSPSLCSISPNSFKATSLYVACFSSITIW